MTELYRGLLDAGMRSPCQALRAARLHVKQTHPDPYYWAPFVFVGGP